MARSEPEILVVKYADTFDRDPWLLNVSNGTVDLRTGKLRPHCRTDFVTRISSVAYDPAAKCPRFDRFLAAIFDADPELVQYVRRVLGYCLTGDTSVHAVHILHGDGANGKSTLTEVLLVVLGEYGSKIEASVLVSDGRDRHPTERADLAGLRLAVASETEEGKRLDVARVKELSGGDKLTARKMRQDFFRFDPTFKLFLLTNHRPRVQADDHGIWRRLRLVPFGVKFWTDADAADSGNLDPELRADPTLKAALIEESPGILATLVAEAVAFYSDRKLTPPSAVAFATKNYRESEDFIGQFFDERVICGCDYRIKASELFAAYKNWCETQGVRADGSRAFGEKAKKYADHLRSNGNYYRARLREDPPPECPADVDPEDGRVWTGGRDFLDKRSPAPARRETYVKNGVHPSNPSNPSDAEYVPDPEWQSFQ